MDKFCKDNEIYINYTIFVVIKPPRLNDLREIINSVFPPEKS